MLSCVTPPAPEDAEPPATPTPGPVEPSATPEPTAHSELTVVELVETHTDVETVDTTEFPADNCQGTQLFAVHMTASRTTIDQMALEGSFSPDFVELVRTSLEDAYGAAIGEQTERTVEFWREVGPGSFLQFPFAWRRLRSKGYLILESVDGESIRVPYELTHSLHGELGDPIDVGCE